MKRNAAPARGDREGGRNRLWNQETILPLFSMQSVCVLTTFIFFVRRVSPSVTCAADSLGRRNTESGVRKIFKIRPAVPQTQHLFRMQQISYFDQSSFNNLPSYYCKHSRSVCMVVTSVKFLGFVVF